MEIDVGASGISPSPITDATAASQLLQFPYRADLDPPELLTPDRKRKKPASSTTALKSILRQRSDIGSSYSARQKQKRRRAVKFALEEKPEEVRRWNGKRLRCLALDLDRWDNLPETALRTINKQKTRHTKRIKFFHTIDDPNAERSSGLVMDDGAFSKCTSNDQKETQNKDGLTPVMPDVQLIEKSYYVDRWLQHSSKSADTDSKPMPYSPEDSSINYGGGTTGSDGVGGKLVLPSADPNLRLLGSSPATPDVTSSLLSLSFNFNTLSLQKTGSRQD